MKRLLAVVAALVVCIAAPVAQPMPGDRNARAGDEKIDYIGIERIRDEGLNRSEVMDHLWWLTEVHGPRLTGSPSIRHASDWAMKRFGEWGLANVHREGFAFGRGWSIERFSAHLLEPQVQPLLGYPKAWSPGTSGIVSGEVIRAQIATDADFATWRGKLRGKIVLTQPARDVRMLEGPIVMRMGEKELEEAATSAIPPAARPRPSEAQAAQRAFQERLAAFLKAEGAVAALDRGSDDFLVAAATEMPWRTQRTDGGTIFVGSSGSRSSPPDAGVPAVTLAVEHYNRLVRLVDKSIPVKVELQVDVKFHEEGAEPNGFNTVAELPGTDLAREVVMIGAHFDSTHAAIGATDNAAGSAAMMEAIRILKAIGVRPRRTIRIGLWGGEEQGLLGSRAYVREHFGDPATMVLKPEHDSLAAYFNIDNGTGRIRGVWLQSNLAVQPIFEQWMAPLRDLGVKATSPRSVGGTDHLAFDAVGLPGFQFIQDRLEYNSRTHHSNMDVYDRIQRDDMVQMSTVAAVFAWQAANREAKLPRKTLPKPTGTQ
jgi:carboxypeptidase Q